MSTLAQKFRYPTLLFQNGSRHDIWYSEITGKQFAVPRHKAEIPAPSAPSSIPLTEGEFVNYIACDTMAYRKMYHNKSVKKTLTIPEWLNEAATAMELNLQYLNITLNISNYKRASLSQVEPFIIASTYILPSSYRSTV